MHQKHLHSFRKTSVTSTFLTCIVYFNGFELLQSDGIDRKFVKFLPNFVKFMRDACCLPYITNLSSVTGLAQSRLACANWQSLPITGLKFVTYGKQHALRMHLTKFGRNITIFLSTPSFTRNMLKTYSH